MDNDKYSSDSPVHSASQDKFSRWAFAERIAGVISERKEPSSITIAVVAILFIRLMRVYLIILR